MVSANSGYELDQLISSPVVELTEKSENVYTFIMPEDDVTIMSTLKQTQQSSTEEGDVVGSYTVSRVERHYNDDRENYVPDMSSDYWRHTYLQLNDDQTATIITYMDYTEPDIYVFTTSYTSLSNGDYEIDISFDDYGFFIENAHVEDDTLTFELITSYHTDYYTFIKTEEIPFETGALNGTYVNNVEQTVVVNNGQITFEGIPVDHVIGNTAFVSVGQELYILQIEVTDEGFISNGVAYDKETDTFTKLTTDDVFVKTN